MRQKWNNKDEDETKPTNKYGTNKKTACTGSSADENNAKVLWIQTIL
jgi:hypothetical protein